MIVAQFVDESFGESCYCASTLKKFLLRKNKEIFSKHPLLPDFGVPDDRDLSTGSNFNPPPNFGG